MLQIELDAAPYILCLSLECAALPDGTLVRRPDNLEGKFKGLSQLLILLEVMSEKRWWQHNGPRICAEVGRILAPNHGN